MHHFDVNSCHRAVLLVECIIVNKDYSLLAPVKQGPPSPEGGGTYAQV